MKSFAQYIQLKENDLASSPNMMNPSANQAPPYQEDGVDPEQSSPEARNELETITRDIQKQVERLFKVVNKHKISKQKSLMLLQNIIGTIANQSDLSAFQVKNAAVQGMATNSAGITPPMQPMANG